MRAHKGKLTTKKSVLEKWLGAGILLVFAVLPLLYLPSWPASYVTSKQYILMGTVEVLAVLWVWLLLKDERYRLTRKNMFWLAPLALFLVSLTISAIIGVDPATSFFSTVESGTGLLLLYHVFLFTCIITSFVRVQQKDFFKRIAQATLFASVILAAATFFTGPNGVFTTQSPMLVGSSGGAMMGNLLLVGAYFIFSIFLALYLVRHESRIWKKALYAVSIAIIVFSPIYFNPHLWTGIPFAQLKASSFFLIGQARVATGALIVGLLVSLFTWLWIGPHQKITRVIGMGGIIAMVIVGVIGIQQIIIPSSAAHTFFVKESGNRIVDWQTSLQGIKEKPLLGWGPENSHAVYQRYFNPIVYSAGRGNEVYALHPHNNTLEVLVDGGVIGFLLYLLVLVFLFRGLWLLYRRNAIDSKTYAVLMGMLVAFILQQQMIYDSIVSYVMFFFIIAIVAGLLDTTDERRQLAAPIAPIGYVGAVAVTVLAIPALLYAVYWPAQKMAEFQQVANMTSDKRAEQYQHLFHSTGSYAIDTDPEFFTGPLFYSYDAQKETLKSNALYQKVASTEIQSLLTAVSPLVQTNPYDYHLTLSLMQLDNLQFYLTNDAQYLAQADTYYKQAVVLSATDPELYFTYAQTLVYEKNVAGAKALLDKATALNPDFHMAAEFKSMLK
jgi:O-antigen ligase